MARGKGGTTERAGTGGERQAASGTNILRGLVAAILLFPVVAVLTNSYLTEAPLALKVATSTGVLALSLLVVQVILPGRPVWLVRALGTGLMRWHRAIALFVVGLVLLHVGALFVYSPGDTIFAFSLASPTYSRLGVIALVCLLLTLALGRRQRFSLGHLDWRVFHIALALGIVGTAFAHAAMVQGALDGPVGSLLLFAGAAVAGGSILYAGLLRPLRSRDQKKPRWKEPGTEDTAS